jgi:hypothetical protein
MGEFYRANVDRTLGVGTKMGQVWFPLPQVASPRVTSTVGRANEGQKD